MNLTREEVLTGRIVDADGRPVPEAVISGRAAEPWRGVGITFNQSIAPDETVGTARTDAAGRFSLHGVRTAERYLLTITASDLTVANTERVVTAGSEPIELTLAAATPVRLVISGLPDGPLVRLGELRPGEPGPGISLEWLDPAGGAWQAVSSPRRVIWLESDGAELQFDQVPSGFIRVVTRGDWTTATDVSDPVPVTGGMPVVIPVPLVRNVELRLRVHHPSGSPVPGARVEMFSHTGRSSGYASTGADGSVTFRVHPTHDVKVTVTIGTTLVATTAVRGGADTLAIVVPAR